MALAIDLGLAKEKLAEDPQAAARMMDEAGAVLRAAGGALQRCGQASVGFVEDDFGEGTVTLAALVSLGLE
ncbi:hypothetical protein ACFCZY_33300 [Streptomyces sp. NPDC056237]|uniref:hypothetical protein n=1 Tax=unclassified Streptomyces TaxID=2593676 RepID=UPI0035D853B2